MKFISFSSFFTPDYVPLSAWLQHIPFAFWLTEQLKPELFVELGVHTGASYFSFCQGLQKNDINCTCYGIDTWQGDAHAGHYDDKLFNEVTGYNHTNYSRFSYLLKSTFDEALNSFENNSIDLLHIDGYHVYESVKQDFENWLPKLSDKAVVLFHDTNVRERGFGVYKLWEELEKSYPSFEFNFGYGLGVLGVGKNIPESVKSLLLIPGTNEKSQVNELYARLGGDIANRYTLSDLSKQNSLLREETINKDHQISEQQTKIENGKRSTAALEAKIAEQNEHIDTIRSACNEETSQKNQLASKFENMEARYDRIKEALIETQEKTKLLEAEVSQKKLIELELDLLHKQLSGKEEAIGLLNIELSKSRDHHLRSVADFNNTVKQQLDEAGVLATQLKASIKQTDELTAYSVALQSECEEKISKIDLLKKAIKELETLNQRLNNEIELLKKAYSRKTIMQVVKGKFLRSDNLK